jgi:ubiquinone/menaquinone biosynthesis C-methylase UbiE
MAEGRPTFDDAESYERFMGQWSRAVGMQFLEWLAPPKHARWLDVGCGTGAFTELLLARCAPAQVDGIDPSEDQIGYARKRQGAAQARLRSGDAQALPYGDAEFDAAAMALVISFVPDPTKAVSEMRRVVKPGGTVAAYIWHLTGDQGFTQWPLIDALQRMGHEVVEVPGRIHSTIPALRSIFEAAGLTSIETRPIDIEVSYADFDDYWSSQTGLPNPAVQLVRKLPAADVERLKDDLRQSLPRRDGRIVYPASANAIKGTVPRGA